jgi:hypothetical protein
MHRYRAACATHFKNIVAFDDRELERLRGDVGDAAAGWAAHTTKVRIGQVRLWQKTHLYEPSYFLWRLCRKMGTSSS